MRKYNHQSVKVTFFYLKMKNIKYRTIYVCSCRILVQCCMKKHPAQKWSSHNLSVAVYAYYCDLKDWRASGFLTTKMLSWPNKEKGGKKSKAEGTMGLNALRVKKTEERDPKIKEEEAQMRAPGFTQLLWQRTRFLPQAKHTKSGDYKRHSPLWGAVAHIHLPACVLSENYQMGCQRDKTRPKLSSKPLRTTAVWVSQQQGREEEEHLHNAAPPTDDRRWLEGAKGKK